MHCQQKRIFHFIIGGKDGIAQKAKSRLEEQYPDIKIVGTYAPPFGFEHNENELTKINQMISEKNPDLLIACFGCPKQEKWIYENYKNIMQKFLYVQVQRWIFWQEM